MPYQNISAQVSDADVQAVKAAVATIQQKLPFLVSLTQDERKGLFKAGPNSLSFVENSLQAAKNNPGIFPGAFNAAEFESDVKLFSVLTDLNITVAQLASQVNDTRMAVGSEAMNEATQIYNYVKAAVKTTPGLKPVADQLGERFQKTTVAKAPVAPAQ
jgi:peptidyl-tRNA hydrolase